jgi:hypothetical protein
MATLVQGQCQKVHYLPIYPARDSCRSAVPGDAPLTQFNPNPVIRRCSDTARDSGLSEGTRLTAHSPITPGALRCLHSRTTAGVMLSATDLKLCHAYPSDTLWKRVLKPTKDYAHNPLLNLLADPGSLLVCGGLGGATAAAVGCTGSCRLYMRMYPWSMLLLLYS